MYFLISSGYKFRFLFFKFTAELTCFFIRMEEVNLENQKISTYIRENWWLVCIPGVSVAFVLWYWSVEIDKLIIGLGSGTIIFTIFEYTFGRKTPELGFIGLAVCVLISGFLNRATKISSLTSCDDLRNDYAGHKPSMTELTEFDSIAVSNFYNTDSIHLRQWLNYYLLNGKEALSPKEKSQAFDSIWPDRKMHLQRSITQQQSFKEEKQKLTYSLNKYFEYSRKENIPQLLQEFRIDPSAIVLLETAPGIFREENYGVEDFLINSNIRGIKKLQVIDLKKIKSNYINQLTFRCLQCR